MKIKIFFVVAVLALQISAQSKNTNTSMVKIEVLGLTCPFCAYGLEKKLRNEIKTLNNFKINFEKSFVAFNFPQNDVPSKNKLIKIVEDSGFEVYKITYYHKK